MPIPVNIKTTNLELTDAITDYAQKQFSKLDQFVSAEDTTAHAAIELAKTLPGQNKGDVFRAEINLKIAGHQLYTAAERDDLYAAIDEVRDEMIREIRKTTDRDETLFRKGARAIKKMMRSSK